MKIILSSKRKRECNKEKTLERKWIYHEKEGEIVIKKQQKKNDFI